MKLTQQDLDAIKDLIKITIEEDETLVRKLDLSFLPTREEFFSKMDEVVGELKAMRDEHKLLSRRVYEDHEPRLQKIEKKLQIQTSD